MGRYGLGRSDPLAQPSGNDRYLRSPDGWNGRISLKNRVLRRPRCVSAAAVSEAKLGLSRDQQSRIDCVNELRLAPRFEAARRRARLDGGDALHAVIGAENRWCTIRRQRCSRWSSHSPCHYKPRFQVVVRHDGSSDMSTALSALEGRVVRHPSEIFEFGHGTVHEG
jgi:hypothetical protein